MKRFAILVLSLGFLAVACSQKTPAANGPRASIIGTWAMNGVSGITQQFNADGSFISTAVGIAQTGTYRWLDDTHVETSVGGKTTQWKVGISQDQLAETDAANNIFTFQRVTAAQASAAPPSGSRALIVGTWWSMVAGKEKITMQFAADGTYSTTFAGKITNGTYKWIDDATIETTVAGKSSTLKVAVTQDQLTMSIGNETSTFNREGVTAAQQSSAAPSASSTTPAPPGKASITRAVMATQMTPINHVPVVVTDTFPASQGTLLAVVTVVNAPAGTRLKYVLTAIDTHNVHPPNSQAGQPLEMTTQGTQNVAAIWQYPNLPVGTYKVDVYLNDTLDRTLNFSVTKDATAPSEFPTPGVVGNCPALPASNEQPPGFPIGVTMAQGQDAQGKPVNPGRIFRPDAPAIYAVLTTEKVPANTRAEARWFATDLGGVEACNTQMARFEMPALTAGNPYFYVNSPRPVGIWPEGLYRIEIYVNGNLALRTDFAVCGGQCKFKVTWPAQ